MAPNHGPDDRHVPLIPHWTIDNLSLSKEDVSMLSRDGRMHFWKSDQQSIFTVYMSFSSKNPPVLLLKDASECTTGWLASATASPFSTKAYRYLFGIEGFFFARTRLKGTS